MNRQMTDEQIHEAFARMVRKQDYWRGYFGDEIEDAEVLDWLDRAANALLREHTAEEHSG